MINNKSLYNIAPLIIMFCIGMYLMPLRLMHLDLSYIPGDLGDARLNNYLLEHGYKWITGQVTSFWDAPFYYPVISTISFSDNHLGTLPIYAVFRFLHFDRETAYQLWFLVVFSLNYVSCAWVLRKLSIHSIGAAAGAFIFTFSLPVFEQTRHSQLLPRFMIPIAMYFAYRFFEKPDAKKLVVTCLTLVVQFYCTMYMGFFLVLGLLVFFAVYIVMQNERRAALKRIIGSTAQAMLARATIISAAIATLLPIIIPYYHTSLVYGVRSWDNIKPMLPTLKSYLFPASGSLLWSWLYPMGNALPMAHEHRLFMGAIAYSSIAALLFIFYRNRSNQTVRFGMMALMSLCVLVLLTLNMRPSLYRGVLLIPGMTSIRAVSRIVLFNLFFAAVIIGVVLTKIEQNYVVQTNSLVRRFFIISVLVLVPIDHFSRDLDYMSYSKTIAQERSRKIERIVSKEASVSNVIVYMPENTKDPEYEIHIDAMMAAQNLNMATVNGYSGIFPTEYYDSLFLHYDRCESLSIWKTVSSLKGYDRGDHSLLANISIVGRESCGESHYRYSFMTAALPAEGCKATITFPITRIDVARGQTFTVSAAVTNTGSSQWRSLNDTNGTYRLRLSYRWLSRDRLPLGGFDIRENLPYDVSPKEKALFAIIAKAPEVPGIYYLEFDMVQELVTWFRDKGSPTSLLKVKVL